MNHQPQQQRIKHPYNTVNLLSKVTFFYAIKLLKKGYTRTFTEEDLYEIPTGFKSTKLRCSVERQWKIKNGIFFIIVRSFGLCYLSLGLIKLLADTIFTIVQPYILEKLLSYFSPKQTNKCHAILYVILMIIFSLLQSIFNHNFLLFLKGFGIKVRTTFFAIIYRRILTLTFVTTEEISIGKVITFFSKDTQVVDNFINYGNELWVTPIKLLAISYMLYQKAGPIILITSFLILLALPIQGLIAENVSYLKNIMLQKTDKRLQITQETLSQITTTNIDSEYCLQNICDVRRLEIQTTHKLFYLQAFGLTITDLTSRGSLYIFIVLYTWFGYSMTIETLLFIVSCFSTLSESFGTRFTQAVYQTAELITVIKRFGKFFEQVDRHRRKEQDDANIYGNKYKIHKGLTWFPDLPNCKRDVLVSALLKNCLKKNKKISYTDYKPWLFSSTIRQNIVFGEKYEDNRYQKVLEICALCDDVDVLKYGDLTLVVNAGTNLNKSLRAKINLARAVYRQSQVYFFDDCLTDFGDNTSDFIFNCHKFLQDKIVVFATHTFNGRPESDNCVAKARRRNSFENTIYDLDVIPKFQSEECTKLIIENSESQIPFCDNIKSEYVDFKVYKKYLSLGGTLVLLLIMCSVFLMFEIEKNYLDNLVTFWVYLEEKTNKTHSLNITNNEERQSSLLQVYGIMTIATAATIFLKFSIIFFFSERVSIRLHRKFVESVIHFPMEFFERSNIFNRLSKDFVTIDENLLFVYSDLLQIFFETLRIIILIAHINRFLLLPMGLLIVVLIIFRRWCLYSLRNFRRIEATTRSPIIDYIFSTLDGLATISVSQVQDRLQSEFEQQLDLNNSSYFTFQCLMKAFAFLQDLACISYITIVVIIFFIVNDAHYVLGDGGLIIIQTFLLMELLKRGNYRWTELETEMIAMERILEYTNVDEQCTTINNRLRNEKMVFENNCFIEESAATKNTLLYGT